MTGYELSKQLMLARWHGNGKSHYVASLGFMQAWGSTVPSDGSKDYAKGCLFIHTDASGAADAIYINSGDKTSSTFVALLTAAGGTLSDGANLAVGTGTGTQIGTTTTQKLGFFGKTPIVQRSSADQAAVVTTASTTTTPYGYTTAAQADNLVKLVNEMRTVLVNLGLMKGSA